MPLEGLPCPDPEDEDRAESFDAVRLFVKAARRVEPDFAGGGRGAAIVDVCRQVEGLPLAIELARRLGAHAVVPGHRRRAASRHRAAARRRPAPPAAPRQHRDGVRAFVAAPRRGRAGGALAPVRLPRRLLVERRAAVAGASLPCSARSPTSRCWPRTASGCACTRWCSSSPPCGWATMPRGPRPRLPTRPTSIAGCASSSRRARAATARRCRRSTVTSRTAAAPANSRSPGARARRCSTACRRCSIISSIAPASPKAWRCSSRPSNRRWPPIARCTRSCSARRR